MDGSAIALGLASTPGPSWLKDVVPKVGQRLKVHNALRALYSVCQVSKNFIRVHYVTIPINSM